jgi:hypothetical protein
MSGRALTSVQKQSAPAAPLAGRILRRKCACGNHATGGVCDECKEQAVLQRKAAGQNAPETIPPIVRDVLNSPGQPLEKATAEFMESRFGHDLSGVQVHTDARAQQAAAAVNARAFAFGHHLTFGAGEYSPQTMSGSRLLAHEIAHVVQQTGQRARKTESNSAEQLEQSANRAADAAISGFAPVAISDASAPRLARAPNPQNNPQRNFENAVKITVELPLGSFTPERLGAEKDFHGYLPASIVEDDAKWHASHAVGPIVGVEREEGILLAPRGVNLSVQKNLENYIREIREVAPEGSKLTLKIEALAHPGTRRLATINYELHVSGAGGSGPALTASVRVSDDISRPVVDVSVSSSFAEEASRRYRDGFNIRKQRSSSSESDKSQPLRPRSPAPATYSSSSNVTKRHEVPNPEVEMRRPAAATGSQPTAKAQGGEIKSKAATTPGAVGAGAVGGAQRVTPSEEETGRPGGGPSVAGTPSTKTQTQEPALKGGGGVQTRGPRSSSVRTRVARNVKAIGAGIVKIGLVLLWNYLMAKLSQYIEKKLTQPMLDAKIKALEPAISASLNDGIKAIADLQLRHPGKPVFGNITLLTTIDRCDEDETMCSLEVKFIGTEISEQKLDPPKNEQTRIYIGLGGKPTSPPSDFGPQFKVAVPQDQVRTTYSVELEPLSREQLREILLDAIAEEEAATSESSQSPAKAVASQRRRDELAAQLESLGAP